MSDTEMITNRDSWDSATETMYAVVTRMVFWSVLIGGLYVLCP